jgi:hypothetical protein
VQRECAPTFVASFAAGWVFDFSAFDRDIVSKFCNTNFFRLLQVRQLRFQLLQAEALPSLLFSIARISAENRVRFVTIRFPE